VGHSLAGVDRETMEEQKTEPELGDTIAVRRKRREKKKTGAESALERIK